MMRTPELAATRFALILMAALAASSCGGDGAETSGDGTMQGRLDQFAPVTLTFDASLLDADQRRVLRELVEASRHLDEVFRLQAWRGNAGAAQILPAGNDAESIATREYFQIMYGPWDRLLAEQPFIDGVGEKPRGAGFYPEDLTAVEFEEWLAAHPGDEASFKSYYTLIERGTDGSLRAVPYSVAFSEHLQAAAENLLAGAERANNPSLKRFLELRAGSLLSDEYYESEVAWMRLSDNLIEPTLGPYEVYEDGLFGYKASYESFIGIKDPAESERLAALVATLPELERSLPIPDQHKYLDRPFTSPISVVTLAYAAGETAAGIQTTAFNLPNDPRVREEEGTKKVMLRNVIDAKFETILTPIARQLLVPEQAATISPDPYFTRVLMHELAHGLGPDYVTGQPEMTVSRALKERYSAIEEAKADAVGTHSLRVLAQKGIYDEAFLREAYIDHVADLLRCVRFGTTEAHGLGCLTQFNFLREKLAITYDETSGLFAADLEVFPVAIAELAHDYLMIEATGDYEGAGAFMEEHGTVSQELRTALDRIAETVPVDIRPRYAVEEMIADW